MTSTFEPTNVLAMLKAFELATERREFEMKWKAKVGNESRQLEDTATQQEIQVQQTLTRWANG